MVPRLLIKEFPIMHTMKHFSLKSKPPWQSHEVIHLGEQIWAGFTSLWHSVGYWQVPLGMCRWMETDQRTKFLQILRAWSLSSKKANRRKLALKLPVGACDFNLILCRDVFLVQASLLNLLKLLSTQTKVKWHSLHLRYFFTLLGLTFALSVILEWREQCPNSMVIL